MKEIDRYESLTGDLVIIMECDKCKTQFEVSVMIKTSGCPRCSTTNKKGK